MSVFHTVWLNGKNSALGLFYHIIRTPFPLSRSESAWSCGPRAYVFVLPAVATRVASAPAPGSDAAALLASVAQLAPGEAELDDDGVVDADDDDDGEMVHSPPGVGRRGTLAVSEPSTWGC